MLDKGRREKRKADLKKRIHRFYVYDCGGHRIEFDTAVEAQDYIEERHAEEGGFDWISQITDDTGNDYGCSWKVAIEEI
jgi:hypothetical protein